MPLADRIPKDLRRVWINKDQFATTHTWNGTEFTCVMDEEAAAKVRNTSMADLAWGNSAKDIMLYVPDEDFPGAVRINDHGIFDDMPAKILDTYTDHGMRSILITITKPKVVGTE